MPRHLLRWPTAVGAILLLLGVGAWVAAQDKPLALARNQPGDTKPITLYADDVATWKEDGKRIVLLKGLVLVEHGTSSVRCQQAVVWIDEDRFRTTHILSVQGTAEGGVIREDGADVAKGERAVIDLNTRGELRLKSKNGKIGQQPRADDPFYQKVAAERFPAAPKTAVAPAPVPTPASVQRTGFQAPAPPVPSAPPPVRPPPAVAPVGPTSSILTPPGSSGGTPGAAAPGGSSSSPLVLFGASPPAEPTTPVALTPAVSTPAAPTTSSASPLAAAPGGEAPEVVAAGPDSRDGLYPNTGGPVPPLPSRPSEAPADLAPRLNPQGPPRIITIRPRTSVAFDARTYPLPNGEQAVVVTGGINITVRNFQGAGVIDMEADRVVIWTKRDGQDALGAMTKPGGETSREQEFYLAGNVEIRELFNGANRTLHANEVYYDVNRNVAVALKGELEFVQPGVVDPIHLKSDELNQLSLDHYEAVHAEVFSSKLPSDPGLKVYVTNAKLETQKIPKRSIFGRTVIDRTTGQPVVYEEQLFRGTNAFVDLENIPVFYFPYIQGDAADPLGPLTNINIGYNQNVFGFQFDASFDFYNLLGIAPLPGTRWRADIDYLSLRGPGAGTDFNYGGKDLFNLPNTYAGGLTAWGIIDHGQDVLGGGRGEGDPHPEDRGRFTWRQSVFDLPEGFTVLTSFSKISDMNFLEQYYKNEWDTGLDQQTFLYVKQQQGQWAWTGIIEPRLRTWTTETERLPAFDGWLLGQSFWDIFTYNSHASAGYYQLRPTENQPAPVESTQVRLNTARFDWMNELSVPLTAGPVKIVPYGIVDTTYYTEDLNDQSRGRMYVAGGVRASLPLTRLYPDVTSDLFNLQGLNHKMVFSTNYFAAHSDTPFTELPQLDELDDDATDQERRYITPAEPAFNPSHGVALANSTLYNPQYFALRSLTDTSIDTLDTIEELQLDWRQRLQTKRGYPGAEHIVDWMTLDTSATFFPNPSRDNFGTSWAFLQYDYTWNIGDRTAFTSSGWVDPITNGAREFTLGVFLDRPDRTNFYIGYRQLDPLQSRAVTGAVTYVFSPKYSVTGSSTYDFGTGQSLSNSLVLTRNGADVQVSITFTYNALTNSVGGSLLIVPNLLASKRVPGFSTANTSLLGH